jgi:hypothetical protein
MTYLPASNVSVEPEVHRNSRFANAMRTVAVFFETLAAAARVSRAVEARREPAMADLQALGINQKLPKAW